MQRHRGRTDEARRETARAADRKRLGRQNRVIVDYYPWQNEVDVRCQTR